MHKIFEKVAKFAELSGHNTKWKIARMESATIKWAKGPSTQLQMTYQSEIGCDGEHAFEDAFEGNGVKVEKTRYILL